MNRLRQARRIMGFSQRELAKRSRLTQPMISNFERGWLRPGPEIQRRLADALDLPVSSIFAQAEEDKE